MAFCRKLCCCDFSEDQNKKNQNPNSVEMKPYSPSSNYGRDQRTGSLISNNGTGTSPTTGGTGLNDPLMSPALNASSTDPLVGTMGGADGLPMSPLMLNHNASFAMRSSASSNIPTSPGGGGGRRRAVSFAPKGFEQAKERTTSLQPNGGVKGIYKHRSSYGPNGPVNGGGGDGNNNNNNMNDVKFAGTLSSPQTQQALGSPYASADTTGGKEPPDLSLL